MLNAGTATGRLTATARYGSPYGASPRNDQKYVEAARIKAETVPRKPAVVQKMSEPPPPVWTPLPEPFHTHRYRHQLTAAEIPEIIRQIVPLAEKYWRLYMDYRFEYGYYPGQARQQVVSNELIQREADKRTAKARKYLEELGPNFVPTTDDIIAGMSVIQGGWGTTKKLNKHWDASVPTIATCCGSMNRNTYPGHYPAQVPTEDSPNSQYRKIWFEQVDHGQTPQYTYPLHHQRLVLEDPAFDVHMFWNDE